MKNKNIVFIAQSLDGYIADRQGGVAWLHLIPNPTKDDMGYNALIEEIDAIVMGRTTFETVLGFGIDWPYDKPVIVLSSKIKAVPLELVGKVNLLSGDPKDILKEIRRRGFHKLYIDGGTTVQNFLAEDLIDELRITTIPILLGGGFSLFGELLRPLEFEHLESKLYLNQVVQNHYRRKK